MENILQQKKNAPGKNYSKTVDLCWIKPFLSGKEPFPIFLVRWASCYVTLRVCCGLRPEGFLRAGSGSGLKPLWHKIVVLLILSVWSACGDNPEFFKNGNYHLWSGSQWKWERTLYNVPVIASLYPPHWSCCFLMVVNVGCYWFGLVIKV